MTASPRFMAGRSVIARAWTITDMTTGLLLCPGPGRPIGRWDNPDDAQATADKLNTARIVCVVCRHKAVAAECVRKVCPTCAKS